MDATTSPMPDTESVETPTTWPEKLREAAKWFDTVDRLLEIVEIHDNESGDVRRIIDDLGGPSNEIQTDLRQLADMLDLLGDDHFVTFDEVGWFVEHSLDCRLAETLGNCKYNAAVREAALDFDPDANVDLFGRWRITAIDGMGLPSLERAEVGRD
jgi:hypothetical protein